MMPLSAVTDALTCRDSLVANVWKQGNRGEPASYASVMSRWDPEPTSTERWLVRYRTQVRVGSVLLVLLAIGRIVYLLATGRALGWSLGGSISLITSPLLILFLSWSATSHVEKYDSARNEGPNSE